MPDPEGSASVGSLVRPLPAQPGPTLPTPPRALVALSPCSLALCVALLSSRVSMECGWLMSSPHVHTYSLLWEHGTLATP